MFYRAFGRAVLHQWARLGRADPGVVHGGLRSDSGRPL